MFVRWWLLVLACCLALWLGGCSAPPDAPQKDVSAATFVGSWDTTLPNSEQWRLVLHEDGRFDSIPVHSPRSGSSGLWSVSDGAFHWTYPDRSFPGGARHEINPIILNTAGKFMLQERLGMKSVFARHAE
jgi:hypothetical protein